MTPEELREDVARALCLRAACMNMDDPAQTKPLALYVNHNWPRYVLQADAALAVVREAMREPSDLMMNAGVDEFPRVPAGLPLEARLVWAAMLAASPLREPSP